MHNACYMFNMYSTCTLYMYCTCIHVHMYNVLYTYMCMCSGHVYTCTCTCTMCCTLYICMHVQWSGAYLLFFSLLSLVHVKNLFLHIHLQSSTQKINNAQFHRAFTLHVQYTCTCTVHIATVCTSQSHSLTHSLTLTQTHTHTQAHVYLGSLMIIFIAWSQLLLSQQFLECLFSFFISRVLRLT